MSLRDFRILAPGINTANPFPVLLGVSTAYTAAIYLTVFEGHTLQEVITQFDIGDSLILFFLLLQGGTLVVAGAVHTLLGIKQNYFTTVRTDMKASSPRVIGPDRLSSPTPFTEYSTLYFAYFAILATLTTIIVRTPIVFGNISLTISLPHLSTTLAPLVPITLLLGWYTGAFSRNRVWWPGNFEYGRLRPTITPRSYQLWRVYLLSASLLFPLGFRLISTGNQWFTAVMIFSGLVPSAMFVIATVAEWKRTSLLLTSLLLPVSFTFFGGWAATACATAAVLAAPYHAPESLTDDDTECRSSTQSGRLRDGIQYPAKGDGLKRILKTGLLAFFGIWTIVPFIVIFGIYTRSLVGATDSGEAPPDFPAWNDLTEWKGLFKEGSKAIGTWLVYVVAAIGILYGATRMVTPPVTGDTHLTAIPPLIYAVAITLFGLEILLVPAAIIYSARDAGGRFLSAFNLIAIGSIVTSRHYLTGFLKTCAFGIALLVGITWFFGTTLMAGAYLTPFIAVWIGFVLSYVFGTAYGASRNQSHPNAGEASNVNQTREGESKSM